MRAINLCYTALFTALIVVSGWICLPVGEIKYTLQLLAVLVCGGVLGVKYGFLAVFVYLLLGAVGVPVFSGFTAGLFSTPTSGYTVGFLFAVVFSGVAYKITPKNQEINLFLKILFTSIGVIFCYFSGVIWFMLYTASAGNTTVTLLSALGVCVLPYLWFDAVKIALALLLTSRLNKILKINIKISA